MTRKISPRDLLHDVAALRGDVASWDVDEGEVAVPTRELRAVFHLLALQEEWLRRCDGAIVTALEAGIKDVSTHAATRNFDNDLREFLACLQ